MTEEFEIYANVINAIQDGKQLKKMRQKIARIITPKYQNNCLCAAAQNRNLYFIKEFVAIHGSIVNISNIRSPLMCAAQNNDSPMVKYLLTMGSQIDNIDEAGWSALIYAAYNSPEVVRILVDNGANVNMIANNGLTALHRAAYSGNRLIIDILIEKGAKEHHACAKSVLSMANHNIRSYLKEVLDQI